MAPTAPRTSTKPAAIVRLTASPVRMRRSFEVGATDGFDGRWRRLGGPSKADLAGNGGSRASSGGNSSFAAPPVGSGALGVRGISKREWSGSAGGGGGGLYAS